MSQDSKIEWTDHTFNVVWGCTKVGPECKNCYAEGISHHYGFGVWGPNAPRRTFGAKYWAQPLKWNRDAEKAGKRAKVFCSSMCDIGEDHATVKQELEKLWPLIKATPWLTWQLLTKRPERYREILPADWGDGYPNVWLGTSVGLQKYMWRVVELLKVRAGVRFVSAEPLLGALDFTRHFNSYWRCDTCGKAVDKIEQDYDLVNGDCEDGCCDGVYGPLQQTIHLVIVGGESGPGARPMHPDWARSVRNQCVAAGVKFFFKQWGEWAPASSARCSNQKTGRSKTINLLPDGSATSSMFPPMRVMVKVGRNAAGRMLYGREWNELPGDCAAEAPRSGVDDVDVVDLVDGVGDTDIHGHTRTDMDGIDLMEMEQG